ncbi:MAG: hypothetical protein KDJ65_10970 [Anaerolineae bacterium]|nr:hypothetical protein [Anaerolineae bacterium]
MSKADQGGPFREFIFTDWLKEGIEGICEEAKDAKEQFEVENIRRHLRNASKEQLLAVRSIIDNAIDFIDKQEAKKEKI